MKYIFMLAFLLLMSGIAHAEPGAIIYKPVPSPTSYEPPPKNFEEVKATLDGLYSAIQNNPTYKGAIIIYGTKKVADLREAQIKRFIRFRRYDLSQVVFFRSKSTAGIKWYMLMVPAKYQMENIRECLLKIEEPEIFPYVLDQCFRNAQSQDKQQNEMEGFEQPDDDYFH